MEVQLTGDASVVSIRIDDDDRGDNDDDGFLGREQAWHTTTTATNLAFPVEGDDCRSAAGSAAVAGSPTRSVVASLAHRLGGGGLDDSRFSVNTHNSILDITLDEDDPQHDDGDDDDNDGGGDCSIDDPAMDGSASPSSTASTPTPASPRPSCPLTPPSLRGGRCCHSADLLAGSTPPVASGGSTSSGNGKMTHRSSSLLDLTERFVGLCFGDRGHVETPRSHPLSPPPENTGSSGSHRSSASTGKGPTRPSALAGACQIVHDDFFHLLGCPCVPDADEVDQVWTDRALFCFAQESSRAAALRDAASAAAISTALPRPQRLSRRRRAIRLHRLRAERNLPRQRTGLPLLAPSSSPITDMAPVLLAHRSRSFDPRVLRVSRSVADDEAGYDSDPGEALDDAGAPPQPILPLTTPWLVDDDDHNYDDDGTVGGSDGRGCYAGTARLQQVVQESLNLQWTLTWHLPVDPAHPHCTAAPAGTPSGSLRPSTMCVQAWLERGTVVNGTTLLEPNLMWREAYQPHLHQHRRLNASTRAPYALKLLNVCRIVDVDSGTDASLHHPLARPSCSFVVRTVDAGDYLLEATSPRAKRDVVHRWKCVVARFAALAVLERLDALVEEFFARGVPSHLSAIASSNSVPDGEEGIVGHA